LRKALISEYSVDCYHISNLQFNCDIFSQLNYLEYTSFIRKQLQIEVLK
jgi:hypothetical protein